MAFCLATSTIYFKLSPIASMTAALVDNSTPTVWDLAIALAGGFAGGLGMSRDQEPATLISGVAVATALMPPLCAAGFGIAGTLVFAIPCVLLTANSIGSAEAGVEDGYGVSKTTRELAAVAPGFARYAVDVEVSASGQGGTATREVVARVTSDEVLDERDRATAERLIRLNVPALDRVEFVVSP